MAWTYSRSKANEKKQQQTEKKNTCRNIQFWRIWLYSSSMIAIVTDHRSRSVNSKWNEQRDRERESFKFWLVMAEQGRKMTIDDLRTSPWLAMHMWLGVSVCVRVCVTNRACHSCQILPDGRPKTCAVVNITIARIIMRTLGI